MPHHNRKISISNYLKLILDSYSQKIFDSQEPLTDFYNVISGIMFEKHGFLAQAFLCYQSSKHPFATYSLGYYYEHGLGGNRNKADKAIAYYTKVKEEIVEAKVALEKATSPVVEDVTDASKKDETGLIHPSPARELEIEQTLGQLISAHSQKLSNSDFNQLLVGMMYEKCGYPVQAYLIYRNTKQMPQSLYNMAYLLENGIGLPLSNLEKAKRYYEKAKSAGIIKAVPDVSKLAQDKEPNVDKEPPKTVAESLKLHPAANEQLSEIAHLPQTTVVVTSTIIETSTPVLLFGAKKTAPGPAKASQNDELRNWGEDFHSKRLQKNVTKAVLLPSYLGMLKILEARATKADGKSAVNDILFNCSEIIKLDNKFPLSAYPGSLTIDEKVELQYYLFKAHYYFSIHAIEPHHRQAHKKQALIEAQVYCELAGSLSTTEATFVKNYYIRQRFNDVFKKMAHNREFSQTSISIVALALARIHRNSNDSLFFDVISKEYKFCPIQSIKLALDLMQSALTMANDTKTRKLVIRDIEFMKEHFAKEVEIIKENSPSIVDTSRKADNLKQDQLEKKLSDLIDTYLITIEELFVKDRTGEVVPNIMREISTYFKREGLMRNATRELESVAGEIQQCVKQSPRTTTQRSTPRKAIFA